jgi:uncharacterized membrane protein YeaQ/YmgE (transglycosylase-associated protein family)
MNLLAWTILGLLAGAIAKAIYPGEQRGGILPKILLGIIGAFMGGTLHNIIATGSLQLVSTTFTIPGVAIAVLGAILAIYLWSLVSRNI